jgi:hypothetical protein
MNELAKYINSGGMEFFERHDKKKRAVVPVDKASLQYLWKQRHSNATVGACCAYLSSRLLGMGFKFTSSSGRQPSVEFSRHVRQNFVPFARNALDAIIVHGFVVYGFMPPKKGCPYPTPYIYANDAFDANMTVTEHCQLVMTVDDAVQAKRKRHSVFVHDMPAADGTLTSRLALVAKSIAYLEEIEKNDIQAFAIRARPPVLTRAKADNVFDSRDVISGMEPGLRAQDESDNITVRNRIAVAQFKQQHELIRGLNKNRIDSSSQFWSSQMDPNGLAHTLGADADGFIPRFIPLPTDVDVANFHLPEEKRDLQAIQKYVKTQVCMGLGVPESFVQGTGGGGGGNNILAVQAMTDFVRISISPLREAINDLMVRVFTECFMDEEEGDNEIECFFPSLQDPNQLMGLFKDGLITRAALGKAMMPIFNLEEHDIIKDVVEQKQVAVMEAAEEEELEEWPLTYP